VETAILDNPSAANFEELGELYWDEKQYEKAREAFDAPRNKIPLLLRRLQWPVLARYMSSNGVL
jgi:hypothetical protein